MIEGIEADCTQKVYRLISSMAVHWRQNFGPYILREQEDFIEALRGN